MNETNTNQNNPKTVRIEKQRAYPVSFGKCILCPLLPVRLMQPMESEKLYVQFFFINASHISLSHSNQVQKKYESHLTGPFG